MVKKLTIGVALILLASLVMFLIPVEKSNLGGTLVHGESRYYYLGRWVWVAPQGERDGYWTAPDSTVGNVDLRIASERAGSTTSPEGYGFFSTRTELTGTDYIYLGDDLNGSVSTQIISDWETALGLSGMTSNTVLDLLWDTLTEYSDPVGITSVKPLMPTRENALEVYLGGHSLVRSREFTGKTDSHWNKYKDVVQENYKIIKADTNIPAEISAKYLGHLQEKFNLTEAETQTAFIPKGYAKERPRKPTTTVTDDFNRANSGSLGASWNEGIDGGFQVVSNYARGLSGSGDTWAIYATALSTDDMYAQALGKEADKESGVIIRNDNSTKTGYVVLNGGTGVSHQLFSFENPTKTSLATSTGNGTDLVFKVEANGSTIRTFISGAQEISVTNTAITGNLYAGVYANFAGQAVDDFEAADLVVVSIIPKVKFRGNAKLRGNMKVR